MSIFELLVGALGVTKLSVVVTGRSCLEHRCNAGCATYLHLLCSVTERFLWLCYTKKIETNSLCKGARKRFSESLFCIRRDLVELLH